MTLLTAVTLVELLLRQLSTSSQLVLQTPLSLLQKQSSMYSTKLTSQLLRTNHTTSSIRSKAPGTPVTTSSQMALPTVVTRHVTRVDISQYLQPINSLIFAMRWLWNSVVLDFWSSVHTTKLELQDRWRSTIASLTSCRLAMTF